MKDIYIVASDHVVLYCCGRAGGGGGTRAGLETGGAAGAGSPLYSNEWNQMLRTDGARRSETGNVRCALLTCVGLWSLAANAAIRAVVDWFVGCSCVVRCMLVVSLGLHVHVGDGGSSFASFFLLNAFAR